MCAFDALEMIGAICDLLGLKHESSGGRFTAIVTRHEKEWGVCSTDVQHLTSTYQSMMNKHVESSVKLFDAHSLEIPVDIGRLMPRGNLQSPIIHKEDADTGTSYTLSPASNEYLLYLFRYLKENNSLRILRSPIIWHRMEVIMKRAEGHADLFDVLRVLPSWLDTVRITSAEPRDLPTLVQLANAFMFQLSFNLDVPIVESTVIEDIIRSRRIATTRRSSIDDIEPPRRIYVPDLVYHYELALSSDSPALQYLSYYHIAEHFFEEVHSEDLIESVRQTITSPGFSYRRKNDIRSLVKLVEKRTIVRSGEAAFSERDSLRLTLRKYVDFKTLLKSVNEYDSELGEYYRQHDIPFSKGNKVDLGSADQDAIARKLADRIYKTRNCVVHTKDGAKARYIPFQHDYELSKEIPLIRFMAEQIILNTSRVLQ